jgi:hypothetical protein
LRREPKVTYSAPTYLEPWRGVLKSDFQKKQEFYNLAKHLLKGIVSRDRKIRQENEILKANERLNNLRFIEWYQKTYVQISSDYPVKTILFQLR